MNPFNGKLAIQQRVLAAYRAPFFDALAAECAGGLSVCAGAPRPEESISVTDRLERAHFQHVHNVHILSGSLLLCHQQGLPGWLAEWNPDVLIAEVNPRTLSTPAARRWMKRRGRLVLGWGLGAPPPASFPGFLAKAGGRVTRAALRAHLRGFDGLLTYSSRGAQEYEALGFPAERVFVAPNAATPAPSHPPPARGERYTGRPCVLFVGRLQERKRLDTLLHACASLPPALQPRLVIVGDGPAQDPLTRLAKEVFPAAEFAGARYGEELASFFRAADLFVLPGTGGLAVQEAMSHGLPVIMGAGDGTNDQLVRPENGWQVRSPQELAGALLDALGDVPRLRRMGETSYRIVAEEINLDTMVSAFLRALHALTTG